MRSIEFSDDKKADSPDTTTAASVTAPASTEPASTDPATTAGSESDIQYIDPMTLLTPWDGQQLETVDPSIADQITSQLSADPTLAEHLIAVGAITTTDDATGATTLVLFAEFDEPVDSMAADIYSGITSGATDVADVTSGAHEGKAFVQDGMYGFTSVFGTTVVLAMSDNVDAMQTTVDSMFAANPQL